MRLRGALDDLLMSPMLYMIAMEIYAMYCIAYSFSDIYYSIGAICYLLHDAQDIECKYGFLECKYTAILHGSTTD